MRVDSGSAPLAISGLILWSFMCTGCLQPQDFEVRSVSISDFRSLGDEATVVGIDIGLHNPNGYKVDIQESQLGLWVGSDSVGILQFAPGERLARKSDAVVRLDAVLDSRRFSEVLSQNWFEFLVQGAPVKVQGWVRGKAWGVQRTLAIQHEQRIRIVE